jgi:phage-related protein
MGGWTVEVVAEARSELEAWPLELHASLARVIERVEAIGLERLGEPQVRPIEGKLREMRASGRRLVIVLAFQKTTRKTPRTAIELAPRRANALAP